MSAPRRYMAGPVSAAALWHLGRHLQSQKPNHALAWADEHVRGRSSALQTIEYLADLGGRTMRKTSVAQGRPEDDEWAFIAEADDIDLAQISPVIFQAGQILTLSANRQDLEGYLNGLAEHEDRHVAALAAVLVNQVGMLIHYLKEHGGYPCE